MSSVLLVFRRELSAYFLTPIAPVFLVAFLALAAAVTFHLGDYLPRGRADLQPFFGFHPWLFLVFAPALGMRLWAEERRAGTLEFLMTLPLTTAQAVLGKFLAAWAFIGVALALTFPMWITVNWLGDPDNGVILLGYLGSLMLAGGFLAVSACISALTRNQVVAFVAASVACFVLMMSGLEMVQGLLRPALPAPMLDLVGWLSVLPHHGQFTRGVLDLRAVLFFASLIGFCLTANAAIVDLKKR
ncbi:MAG TPA: ABC transporter permease subunit [Azospirillaceae bacterium]|nr:ABC transporter permease subunit [Azospirillaceae bacterium]